MALLLALVWTLWSGADQPGFASTAGSSAASVAKGQVGTAESPDGTGCNKYTYALFGQGSGCPPGLGRKSEQYQWCSDFAIWVWKKAGAITSGLTSASGSFYTYGKSHGTWHGASSTYVPQPGDAILYNLNTANATAAHVGIVVSSGKKTPDVVQGNWGDANYTHWAVRSDPGSRQATGSGLTISGYVSPVGGTSPAPAPHWEAVSGTLTNIDMGPQGKLWGVNSGGAIYEYAGSGKWAKRGSSGFKSVTVGNVADSGGPVVYALKTNGSIVRWRKDHWESVSGNLADIDLGPQGQLWGVNSGGAIYQYAGSGKWAMRGSSGFKSVTVGKVADSGGPVVYALKTNGSIVRWRKDHWESVSGNLADIDLGPQGQLWGVNSGGTIYQYAGSGKWTSRGTGFKRVTVGKPTDNGPTVYAIKTNGAIVRWR